MCFNYFFFLDEIWSHKYLHQSEKEKKLWFLLLIYVNTVNGAGLCEQTATSSQLSFRIVSALFSASVAVHSFRVAH